MNLNYQETFTDPGFTINDNYNNPDEITTLINYTYQRTPIENATDVNGIDTNVLGMYIITYTATDSNNNTSSIIRTVFVEDTTNPIITLNGDTTIILPLDSTYSEPGYNISDNYTDTANINVNIITDLCTNIVGNYSITYTATDEEGNQSSVQRFVEIIDTIPPTVELNGNNPIIVELFNVYTEEGVTASDNVDPDNLLTTTINGTVNTSVAGSYTLTYSVSDTGGQTTNITRTVIVAEAPTAILTDGSSNIFINQDFYYPNVTASDVSGNELILLEEKDQLNQISNDHINIQRNNDTFNNTVSGVYNILYNITDAYNISTTIVFDVGVNDPDSPALTLTYNTTSLDLNSTFDYPLVEGIDSYNQHVNISRNK